MFGAAPASRPVLWPRARTSLSSVDAGALMSFIVPAVSTITPVGKGRISAWPPPFSAHDLVGDGGGDQVDQRIEVGIGAGAVLAVVRAAALVAAGVPDAAGWGGGLGGRKGSEDKETRRQGDKENSSGML